MDLFLKIMAKYFEVESFEFLNILKLNFLKLMTKLIHDLNLLNFYNYSLINTESINSVFSNKMTPRYPIF